LELLIDRPKQECILNLKRFSDSFFVLFCNYERYCIWFIGPFFGVYYYPGWDLGIRRSYTNRALGIIYKKETGTKVVFKTFLGYTDPFSFLIFWLIFLSFFSFTDINISFIGRIFISLILPIGITITSYISTAFSEEGLDADERLKGYIISRLTENDPNKDDVK